MEKKYMVQMWRADRSAIENDDFVWYHQTSKAAKVWAMDYAKKNGGVFFSVLYTFNSGHYRTIVNQEVA